ncbi:hypothetical protein [Bremerella sp. P1]|uniref:hypothetical protein n=1 Tax=Bremerella sp. P1 TaxID=3026424 RepID=UPI002367D1F7|nr:hypothetical protein [Bremerella sp. P1]WDI40472.1 hypothetical protein PSR63_18510 [Bremerella sp. P1]
MRPFDDSISMTPDERRAAIAKILAAGILRLHTRAALPSASASSSDVKNTENPGSPRLEVPGETVLSVHNG